MSRGITTTNGACHRGSLRPLWRLRVMVRVQSWAGGPHCRCRGRPQSHSQGNMAAAVDGTPSALHLASVQPPPTARRRPYQALPMQPTPKSHPLAPHGEGTNPRASIHPSPRPTSHQPLRYYYPQIVTRAMTIPMGAWMSVCVAVIPAALYHVCLGTGRTEVIAGYISPH